MTSKRIILALTTLLTLTCAGLLVAQTTGDTTTPTMEHDQAMETGAMDAAVQTMVGIVQSFDGNSLVLRTSAGEHTFLVASSTVRPAAVQANLPVTVSYVTESGGDRAVRVVENTTASAESQTPGGQVTGADSMAPTGSTYSNTTGSTTGSTTGTTTGSMATHDSMATDTTGAMNDTTGTTTGTTGSTYGSTTGSTYDNTTDTTSSTATTADTTTPSATDNSLPATGSDAPLMGLVGLLALAGAAGLHAFGRNA